jgi:hypothetical protein
MRHSRIAAFMLVVASLAAGTASADDKVPPPGKSPESGKQDPQKDPKKDEAVLRIERAKQLVKELEESIARVKAQPTIDATLLMQLQTALDQAKLLAQPAKPAELTADEKQAVIDEAKKKEPPAKDATNDWADKALAKAFDGTDLSEEESIKAKQIVGDWWKENGAAWTAGDSKKMSDLKRKRDDDLEKAVGHKKAQKIANNLNAMMPGRK